MGAAWCLAFAAVQIRSSLLWEVTQRKFVVGYRCFGTTNRFPFQGLLDPWRCHQYVAPKLRQAITKSAGLHSERVKTCMEAIFIYTSKKDSCLCEMPLHCSKACSFVGAMRLCDQVIKGGWAFLGSLRTTQVSQERIISYIRSVYWSLQLLDLWGKVNLLNIIRPPGYLASGRYYVWVGRLNWKIISCITFLHCTPKTAIKNLIAF